MSKRINHIKHLEDEIEKVRTLCDDIEYMHGLPTTEVHKLYDYVLDLQRKHRAITGRWYIPERKV